MGFFAVFIKQKCDFILVGICRVGKINVLIGVHIRKVNFQRKNFGRNLSRRDLFPIDNRALVMKFPQNLSSMQNKRLCRYTQEKSIFLKQTFSAKFVERGTFHTNMVHKKRSEFVESEQKRP